MLSCWHVALRAEDPAANRYRAYDIRIDRDLFALWNITVSWGRIGTAGTTKTITVESLDEAWRVLKPMLRHRLTAGRRIGCGYRLVSYHLPDGCDLEGMVRKFA
jgi:predicted DNA-binding WGR domain protein